MMSANQTHSAEGEAAMSRLGHRLTPQRRGVYEVLLEERDHPTATEVFLRAKRRMPALSLATVYNCLEALVGWGLAKQVNVEREATRYCANLEEHGHFVCGRCGKVFDVPLARPGHEVKCWQLPRKFMVARADITLRGLCDACNT